MVEHKISSVDDLRREAQNVIDILKERFPGEYRPYALILEEAKHLLKREAQVGNNKSEIIICPHCKRIMKLLPDSNEYRFCGWCGKPLAKKDQT